MIEVKTSELSDGEFNRGVFATRDIKKGELIHAKHQLSLIRMNSMNILRKRYLLITHLSMESIIRQSF